MKISKPEPLEIKLKDDGVQKLLDEIERLNNKIDKAIKYILRLDKDYDINVYQEDKHWAMVLHILEGESNE